MTTTPAITMPTMTPVSSSSVGGGDVMVVGGLVLGVEAVGMVTGADRRTGRKELAGACRQNTHTKKELLLSLFFLKANHSRMIALDNQANKQMTCHFNCHFNATFDH